MTTKSAKTTVVQLAVALSAIGAGWLAAVGAGLVFERPSLTAAHAAALTVAAAFCAAFGVTAVFAGGRDLGDIRRFVAGLALRLVFAGGGLLVAASRFRGAPRDDLLLVGAGLYLTAVAADTVLVYRATLRQRGYGSRA